MIPQRLQYAKTFFWRGHVQVEILVTFPMSSPQRGPRLACTLLKEIARIPTVVTPMWRCHRLLWFADLLASMVTARKEQVVISDMFMNALTSVTQVYVPRKGANCLTDTKRALCEQITLPPRTRVVIFRVTRRMKKLTVMTLTQTISRKSILVMTMERQIRISLCNRTSFNSRDFFESLLII